MNAEFHIRAVSRNGKTSLKSSYYTQPFKLADITEDKNDRTLRLMVMSSSPGILDNDNYKVKIELEEQCSVELQTQSYQRLFAMKIGARQEVEVCMAKACTFIFLPHPSVPHENSSFVSRNKFYLSEECQLIWGEVLTCGRKLSGEVFRFTKYHTQTEIYVAGKLVVKENLLMVPGLIDVSAVGQLEGYTHQASFTWISTKPSAVSVIDDIHELLSREKGVCFGISALRVKGFVVRLLGDKAEQLHGILKMIALHITEPETKEAIIKTTAYAK